MWNPQAKATCGPPSWVNAANGARQPRQGRKRTDVPSRLEPTSWRESFPTVLSSLRDWPPPIDTLPTHKWVGYFRGPLAGLRRAGITLCGPSPPFSCRVGTPKCQGFAHSLVRTAHEAVGRETVTECANLGVHPADTIAGKPKSVGAPFGPIARRFAGGAFLAGNGSGPSKRGFPETLPRTPKASPMGGPGILR